MTDRSLYYSESVSEFMKSVLAVFLIITLLLVIPTSYSFADEDDDDKKSKFKKHKVHTGNGPPPNGLATVGDLYIDSANPDNLIVYKKINKNTWQNLGAFEGETGPQGPPGPPGADGQDGTSDPRADSFFDVFFDVETYSVDSFFDIFTELQESSTRSDSFFDVFFDIFPNTPTQSGPDSFFDVFTELQTDVDTIQTEIVALDLRGQSCNVGDVVTGINLDGTLLCAPDASGSSDPTVLQNQINALTARVFLLEYPTGVDCTTRGPGVDLHGCDLSGVPFVGLDLSGANFSYANVYLAAFHDAILIGADFSNSIGGEPPFVSGTEFNNADLSGTHFRFASFVSADFNNANLSNADLSFSIFRNSFFTNADLSGADLSGADLTGSDFTGADLTGANLACFGNLICNP